MASVVERPPQTKFAPPYYRRPGIRRGEILERIDLAGSDVVLIHAPGGYGKTTLASQMRQDLLAANKMVAWVNLDSEDNRYESLATAVLRAFADAGCTPAAEALTLIKPGILRSVNAALSVFAEDVVASDQDYCLFVDDLHLVTASDGLAALRKLLQMGRSRIRLVLMSRTAAPPGLFGDEGSNTPFEIDVNALRFSFSEARAFLEGRLNAERGDTDNLGIVYEVTEGWVMAMDWAAAAVAAGNPAGTIREALFDESGTLAANFPHRVLAGLSGRARRFLLQTSVLESFNLDLASVVTRNPECADVINQLQIDTHFMLPVDNEPAWFRYHPLFRSAFRRELVREHFLEHQRQSDVLREPGADGEMEATSYELVTSRLKSPEFDLYELHRRAAQWHMDAGMTEQALNHFLCVNDIQSVTGMLDTSALSLLENGRINTLIRLVRKLPPEAYSRRPRIKLCMAWAYTLTCRTTEAAKLIADLEAGLDHDDVLERDEIQALKAAYSIFVDDTRAGETLSKTWRRRGNGFSVAAACNSIGFALIVAGRYEEARETVSWADQKPGVGTLFFPFIYRQSVMALSHAMEGDIGKSNQIARSALELAEKRTGRRSAPACVMMSVLSDGYYEQNRLAELRDLFSFRYDVINESVFPDALIRAYLSGARTYWALGDRAKSRELLDQLYGSGLEHGHTRVMASSLAEKLRQALTEQRLGQAENLLARLEKLISPEAAPALDTHGELVLLIWLCRIRVAMAKGDSDAARPLLELLIDRYRAVGRRRLMARLQLMYAVVNLRDGNLDAARNAVDHSLSLGRACQLSRSFLDDRGWCQELLDRLGTADKPGPENRAYLERLLGAAETEAGSPATDQAIRVDITPKEHEVLQLLEQGLPNKRIAKILAVSPETVRWHLKNIYSKLAVNSRYDAVDRARTLALL